MVLARPKLYQYQCTSLNHVHVCLEKYLAFASEDLWAVIKTRENLSLYRGLYYSLKRIMSTLKIVGSVISFHMNWDSIWLSSTHFSHGNSLACSPFWTFLNNFGHHGITVPQHHRRVVVLLHSVALKNAWPWRSLQIRCSRSQGNESKSKSYFGQCFWSNYSDLTRPHPKR